MADKWPLANGIYSNASNWNGSALPVDGDIIYMDGRTITLDQNIDLPAAEIRTTQRSGGTVGGVLSWSANTWRVRVAQILAGSTTAMSVTATGGLTLGTGTVLQGSNTASQRALSFAGSGPLTFESGCQAKNGTGGANSEGFTVTTITTVNGTVDAICQATVGTAAACSFSGTATINITGAIQHGFSGVTVSFLAAVGTWTITSETCVGATTTLGGKLSIGSASLLLIRQSPSVFTLPTTWSTQHILLNSTSGQSVEYRGDVEQHQAAVVMWAHTSANGTFRHRGTIFGPNVLNATSMFSGSAGGAKFVLDKVAPNASSGRMPLLGAGWCGRTDSEIIAPTESVNVTLVPSDAVGDPPAQSDVRSGVVYHFDTLTGTCSVPLAASVAAGVPIDATVGTAVLTQALAETACNAALEAYDTNGVASVDDLSGVGVDLTPVLEKLPVTGRAAKAGDEMALTSTVLTALFADVDTGALVASVVAQFDEATDLPADTIATLAASRTVTALATLIADAAAAKSAAQSADTKLSSGRLSRVDRLPDVDPGTTGGLALLGATGGGAGDASQETVEEVLDVANSIATALAGGSPVEPTGRIANGGRILAYVGDDFTVRSGTALPIPVKDPAGGLYTLLTAIGVDNLAFGASLPGKPAGLITGTIASITQSGSGSSQLCNISVEITDCGVGLKLSEDYEWQIQSTQTHGDETDTLIRLEGMLSLRRNVVG